MGSDRARLSIDPRRGYRTVVPQQGRVSLEADTNEATRLAETQLREDLIDIVGPSGTPDNGYEVSVAADGSFEVGPGTYYLGGWRVTQDDTLPLGDGPDDLDIEPPALDESAFAFALLLTEQEVSAVEDRALLEVALGGPDTAQRTRLMQRVVAFPAADAWCSDGAQAIGQALDAEGAALDPKTAAIVSSARLRVIPVAPPAPADPCDPPAVGGYLGSDNQLIRVSVIAYDPATGRGKLVWGYDNASTLYRMATSDGRTLTLQADPIDAAHAPRLDQAVEVLRTRARLGSEDVIAADAGLVSTVDQSYDPDLRRLRIADTIPTGQRGDADHPLFLRLWEDVVPFIAGDTTDLGDTGLAVRISLDALGATVVARPFWCFAARPSTPLLVYPRRYLDAAQPPEGPRQWLAPLAMGEANRRTGNQITDDCRETFVPLTRIKPGCCGITLDPDMHGHRDFIQAALDRLKGTRGTVTLRPGHYRLRKPIRLGPEHKGLTLEGCAEGVFLEAADESDPAFAAGLIVLDDVNEVHLRRLQLQMPVTPLRFKDRAPEKPETEGQDETQRYDEMMRKTPASIGVNATGCAQLVIEECQFRFRLQPDTGVFASGLMLRGECWGLTLRRNRFLRDDDFQRFDDDIIRLLFGVTLLPAVSLLALGRGRSPPREARLDVLIEDGDIYDNEFAGLTIAILGFSRIGTLRIERNQVHKCEGGVILLDAKMAATGAALGARFLHGIDILLIIAIGFAAEIPFAGEQRIALSGGDLSVVRSSAAERARDVTDILSDVIFEEEMDRKKLSPLYRTLAVLVSAATETRPAHLHIANNAIDVAGALDTGEHKNRMVVRVMHVESTTGAISYRANPGLGLPALALAFEYGGTDKESESDGDLLITSNRLRTRVGTTALVLLPQRMVFASNLVRGSKRDAQMTLSVLATNWAQIEIMGNVIDANIEIRPPDRSVQPSSDWQFVNNVR